MTTKRKALVAGVVAQVRVLPEEYVEKLSYHIENYLLDIDRLERAKKPTGGKVVSMEKK